MLRSRFLWKLYAGYVALILVATLIVGGLITRWVEQDSLSEIQRSLQARAILLRSLALPPLESSLDSLPGPDFRKRIRDQIRWTGDCRLGTRALGDGQSCQSS
jgi:hypothetical protein